MEPESLANQILSLEAQLGELTAVGKTLSAEKEPEVLLETIIGASLSLTGADGVTLYLVRDEGTGEWSPLSGSDPAGRVLEFAHSRNRSLALGLEKATFPLSRTSIAGHVVLSGESLRLDDAYCVPPSAGYRFNPAFDQKNGYRTKSMLTVPMKDHEDRVLGALQLINKLHDGQTVPFTARDERVIHSLAGQAAVALENSLLHRQREELLAEYRRQNELLASLSQRILKAHEEERLRIARDIHDGPAQAVANVAMKAEIMKKLLERRFLDELGEEIEGLGDRIKGSVAEIRRIIYDLKPTALERGLVAGVENHLASFTRETGLAVEFAHEGDDTELEYYLSSTLYRIAQEALTNVRKYAGASKVRVSLALAAEQVTLAVVDDGAGFDPSVRKEGAEKLKSGFGLEGMRERAQLVRGDLRVESAPGRGTSVSVTVPRGRGQVQL